MIEIGRWCDEVSMKLQHRLSNLCIKNEWEHETIAYFYILQSERNWRQKRLQILPPLVWLFLSFSFPLKDKQRVFNSCRHKRFLFTSVYMTLSAFSISIFNGFYFFYKEKENNYPIKKFNMFTQLRIWKVKPTHHPLSLNSALMPFNASIILGFII